MRLRKVKRVKRPQRPKQEKEPSEKQLKTKKRKKPKRLKVPGNSQQKKCLENRRSQTEAGFDLDDDLTTTNPLLAVFHDFPAASSEKG